MVDASGLGTTCIRLKYKHDVDELFRVLGGDSGLEVTRDITLGDGDTIDLIDAKKSLALVGEKVVETAEEAREQIRLQHGIVGDDGKFQKSIKLAFFNMSAVHSSVGDIKANMDKNDAERAKKEAQEREAEEARLEAEQDAKDIGDLSYYPSARDWVVPEALAEDARQADARFVQGGAPRQLGAAPEPKITRDKTSPDWRPITRYMVSEPKPNGDFKVYIEEPEVVNAERSRISVDFLTSSYSVRVETPGADPLVLGPKECGQIDISACTWRLAEGKRLTLSVVKAGSDPAAKRRTRQGAAPTGDGSDEPSSSQSGKEGETAPSGSTQMIFLILSTLPVLASWTYFYLYKRGEA
mmetsp:Transcript_8425/g.24101  ORF Transcript_8425/g.24101 Transcript_8425/m.24101 type:complete len:354 (-) Transcript_8425:149-1210(-)